MGNLNIYKFIGLVNYTNFCKNMKSYMHWGTDDYETMIVARKDNKNIVMLSQESYNNLMENVSTHDFVEVENHE